MIGQNIVGYGNASMLWPRISMRNVAREGASAQASEAASPNTAARSVAGGTDPAPTGTDPAPTGTDAALTGTDAAPTGTDAAFPLVNDLNRSDEAVVRMEIRYPGERPAFPFADVERAAKSNAVTGVRKSESAAEVMNETKCQTCARRKYQDGSNDPGVSFKTPTKMSPEQAASTVRGHEQEHVVREQAKAEREDRKVVRQSVTIHTDICPECGRAYVSGGVTQTVTADDNREEESELSAPGRFEATA